MGYALPSGVVNTDSVYFYADHTLTLGPHIKQVSDQTLVIIDYTKVEPPYSAYTYQFRIDVSSNPALVVSYPQVNATNEIVTFLLSGGIAGQEYSISIITNFGTDTRTDVLTVAIPSSGDCACETINPVPMLYTQIPLGEPTQGYVNSAVRYFWGAAPPINPSVMDQWYDPTTGRLSEWATDGTTFFWQTMMSSDLITEAPTTGIIYGRYNGYWVTEPIQVDAPQDGQYYSRSNGQWLLPPTSPILVDAPATSLGYWRYNNAWIRDPIQQDAPNDGNPYVRANQNWLRIPPPFPDAPSNGQLYSRVNTNWQPTPVQSDAPPDGQFYARNNNAWLPLLDLNNYVVDAPSNGTLYGRQNRSWVAAYPASNPNGYMDAADVAATYYPLSNPSNYQTFAQMTAANALLMPRAGGTFTGGVQFNIGGVFPTPAQLVVRGGIAGQALVTDGNGNLSWAAPPGGVTDAPNDGTLYARESGVWTHITHTDITDWNATLAPYALTANIPAVPAGSNVLPSMDGVANAGTANLWSRGDHVHSTDTSRYAASNPSGYQTAAQVTAALVPYALGSSIPVGSNAIPVMDGIGAPGSSPAYTRGDHVHPSDTSRLAISGGTMTGPLVFAADPTVPLGAATMQYADNSASNANIDCGTY